MYVIRLYNDDDLLVDVIGDFQEYEEAEKWIRDYAHDNQWGKIIDIGERNELHL